MAVVSVIGPDARLVRTVVEGLRGSRHRVVTGAGPDQADGVIAVVGAPVGDSASGAGGAGGTGDSADDAAVVRAVRDTMGLCVLHVSEDAMADAVAEVAAEPGVVVCRWTASDGPAAPAALETLGRVVESLWVDMRRWTADARRADADRADRVRIAVRLAAERLASELLAEPVADAAGLDRRFRARLTVSVLEQGVEMPHLGPAVGETVGASGDSGASGRFAKADGLTALAGVAALGAGAVVGATVTRTVGAPVIGVIVGVPVAVATFLVRWWTQRSARRTQDAATRAATLRRHWAATVTDVVSRLEVPAVAEGLTDVSATARPDGHQAGRQVVAP